jgi:hypothetical protein
MAIVPNTDYPAQTDVDSAYPQGKARNAGTYQDGTGTPLEKRWVNDLWGFLQSLLADASITPSGAPDEVGASDYLDAVKVIARRPAVDAASLRLRLINTELPFVDAFGFLGVINSLTAPSAIAIKSGAADTHYVFDGDDRGPSAGGSTTGLTSVLGVARNGSRLVAIGAGGNRCNFSTNEGVAWSAGSDLGATPDMGGIIYNATHSRFMVTFGAGVNVAQDVDGASTWASVSSGLTTAQGGIANFANGDTLVGGYDGGSAVEMAVSTDGGDNWAPAATLPNPGDYDDSGTIIGDGGALIYHAGRALVGTELRICATTDALSWTLLATITPPAVLTIKPRILLCRETGVLVVVFASTNVTWAIVSRDGGVTWSDPAPYRTRFVQSFGLARGRLFSTFSTALYATDKLI